MSFSSLKNVIRVRPSAYIHSGCKGLPPCGRRFATFRIRTRAEPTSKFPRSAFLQHEHTLAARKVSGSLPDVADPSAREEPDQPRFDSLKGIISDGTLQALTGGPFNLTHMSPVQAEVFRLLPQLAEPYDPDAPSDAQRPPRDLLVRAKTGTGKTLAFLVPAVESRLRSLEAHVEQAVTDSGLERTKSLEARVTKSWAREDVGTLILSPTRELATQIATEASRLSSRHGMGVVLFTGGTGKGQQMRHWFANRHDIVVATPGRLQDVLNSEPAVAKGLSKTKLLVLDETDTLLDIGFRDDIEAIKKYLPPKPELQTFLFSATVSRNIQQIARSSLDRHLFINTVTDNAPPVHAHVPQYHTVLPDATYQISHVLRLLAHDQLTNPNLSKTIVFLPTTKMTELFARLLTRLSHRVLPSSRMTKVYEIHSKKMQSNRTRTSEAFRSQRSGAAILVSSDVSARGVDYPGVTRIIQVGISGSTEQYVHRVGRTGRAGTGGRGDLVLLPWEMGFLSTQLSEMPLKPLTVGDLSTQVQELAGRFDEDPTSFLDEHTKAKSGSRTPVTSFAPSVSQLIENLDEAVKEVVLEIEEERIHDAFASLLGYYTSRTDELRMDKSAIVEGCKDWAVQAGGQPVPPYVSPALLNRLGVTNELRRSSRGTTSRGSWESRGSGQRYQYQRPGTSLQSRFDRPYKRSDSWSSDADRSDKRSKWKPDSDRSESGSTSWEDRPIRRDTSWNPDADRSDRRSTSWNSDGDRSNRRNTSWNTDGDRSNTRSTSWNSNENRWNSRGSRRSRS